MIANTYWQWISIPVCLSSENCWFVSRHPRKTNFRGISCPLPVGTKRFFRESGTSKVLFDGISYECHAQQESALVLT